MDQRTCLYLFEDQASDISAGLADLLCLQQDPILQAFFEGAYNAIRTELGFLSQAQREQFPRFSSIQDLLALCRRSQLHPSFYHALTCTHQLGSFIR